MAFVCRLLERSFRLLEDLFRWRYHRISFASEKGEIAVSQRTVFQVAISTLALAAVLTVAPAVRAETVALKADLKGSNEVPPNNSTATGTATATLDTQTRILTYHITFAGLSGPVVAAHFHGPSAASGNAGIALPFKSTQSPIEGTATLTETQAADLLAGKWYANLHTAANPGGELRGQMTK
jgi:hypothetical protein